LHDKSCTSEDKNVVKHWQREKAAKGALQSKYVACTCAYFIMLLFNHLLTLCTQEGMMLFNTIDKDLEYAPKNVTAEKSKAELMKILISWHQATQASTP